MRTGPTSDLWWKNAIVYCLDVETYHDADGDGCGDMAGLIERVDHAARLGATCLWLMPFYPTPNRDDGYDIADYLAVDPRLGDLGDVPDVIRHARDRGLRVIVQVGSALSRRGIPLQATYCGAKHALKGFLDSLRVELLHDKSKVRVALVQLPGLNTPQFGWVRTDLHRHPQPVPPIYQPEVAARAIAWAAEHPKRELWVGLPTVYTILGEKFVSGLMDRFLARTNIEAQQTETPIVPSHRDDNLQSPPPGDPGAHGRFDDQAKARSPQLWLATHKRAVAGAAAGAVLGTTALLGARR